MDIYTIFLGGIMFIIICITALEVQYNMLETEVLKEIGFDWKSSSYFDDEIIVKSRAGLEKYDATKYFKENKGRLTKARIVSENKADIEIKLKSFLRDNNYKKRFQYHRLKEEITKSLKNVNGYRVSVTYISKSGNKLGTKEIILTQNDINRFLSNPSLLMSKGEYNKYCKEQQKKILDEKRHKYYTDVNEIIECANKYKPFLFIKGDQEKLDSLIEKMFNRVISSFNKIKTADSEEWNLIDEFMDYLKNEMKNIMEENHKLSNYYNSIDFANVKKLCETLINSQREFNEYINEKVKSISSLFGTKIIRNETHCDDEYSYIRPYKKTITPFTAEVSSSVFASAENNPLEYIVKNFYPNKNLYPQQIQKLYQLIEELETLREAKKIIENYKKEYQKYLGKVPAYVFEKDEVGFYSRLGFANIDEEVLTVEYKFSYTSNGGMAQRTFTVPMTEETIIELIKVLEHKLSINSFVKEQRRVMTQKLRNSIKQRDNFTCCNCGNSIYKEPNLLLEIDHIIPVSKGGYTVESNLQTLCWKCNRSKSNKIIEEI